MRQVILAVGRGKYVWRYTLYDRTFAFLVEICYVTGKLLKTKLKKCFENKRSSYITNGIDTLPMYSLTWKLKLLSSYRITIMTNENITSSATFSKKSISLNLVFIRWSSCDSLFALKYHQITTLKYFFIIWIEKILIFYSVMTTGKYDNSNIFDKYIKHLNSVS